MDDMMDDDSGKIALDTLKQIRATLRTAMTKIPEIDQEEAQEEEAEAPVEAMPEEAAPEEEVVEEAHPAVEKKTVLDVITPKHGGMMPEKEPAIAIGMKLKAKKRGM